jgi:serine/threonine protein kinase
LPEWLSKDAKDLIKSMLKTNPNERITVNAMLSHPWICPHNEQQQNKSIQIIKQNLDEEVFYKCHQLFPETPIKDLRQNILHGFGYQTATYWLLKNKPKIPQVFLIIITIKTYV